MGTLKPTGSMGFNVQNAAFIIFLPFIFNSIVPSNAAGLSECPGIFDPNSWHNCIGVYEHEDAFHYSGQFQYGKYHGHGTSSNISGDKYIGQWKDGQMDGAGTMWFWHGEVWVGSWKSGAWVEGTKYNKGEVPGEIRLLFDKK
tara:strand:+ start:42 stop:470 length:429 start_codon:yes stop_codon:yes gene_type:complete